MTRPLLLLQVLLLLKWLVLAKEELFLKSAVHHGVGEASADAAVIIVILDHKTNVRNYDDSGSQLYFSIFLNENFDP